MKKMLDDMADHYEKGAVYDPKYFETLKTCMSSFGDELLLDSQEAAWKGMTDYFLSNGTDRDYMNQTDHWGGCTPWTDFERCPRSYMRNKSAEFGSDKMIIEEPCNYVSNVAYYRSTTRICDYPDWSTNEFMINAQKRSFATLAMGSAFWHGSHTYVGHSFDNNMIAVIAYLAHQTSVAELSTNSTILR